MSNKNCAWVLQLVKTFWPVVVVLAGIIIAVTAYAAQIECNSTANVRQDVMITAMSDKVDQNSLAIAIITTKLDAMDKRWEEMHKELIERLEEVSDRLDGC